MNLYQFIKKRFYSKTADLDLALKDELKSLFAKYKSTNFEIEYPDVDEVDATGMEIIDSFIKAYQNDIRVDKNLISELQKLKLKYEF